jgi:hypothetical protein
VVTSDVQMGQKLTLMVQVVRLEVDTSDVQIGEKLTQIVQGVEIG